jgi:hypothetical protein
MSSLVNAAPEPYTGEELEDRSNNKRNRPWPRLFRTLFVAFYDRVQLDQRVTKLEAKIAELESDHESRIQVLEEDSPGNQP